MSKRIWLAVLSAGAFIGCSPAADTSKAADDLVDGGDETPVTPGTDGGGGGGGDTDGGGTNPINTKLALKAVKLQQAGRNGDALRIALKGTDPQKNTTSMFVRFRDENDAPVVAVDTDWDGAPDASERRFRFDTSTLGTADFTGVVIVPGLYPSNSKIAKALIALEDDAGGRSTEMVAELGTQVVRNEFEPCDAAKVADRCLPGMSCGGTPATCMSGVAPTISEVAYFSGASPRMLFRGVEQDEDVQKIDVEFLDSAGNPKTVDVSGDADNPDMRSGISIALDSSDTNGPSIFHTTFSSLGFDTKVPKIAATISDARGNKSERLVTAATAIAARAVGQACDYDGFDTCATGAVCSPGIAGQDNKCATAVPLRSAKCKAGPVLDPSKGKVVAFGTVAGASLWDAPAGCVPNDTTGRPEATVSLHLTKTTTLTITTAMPETNFDTAVYLLPTCAATSATALGCNDDTKGYSSSLTLNNVAAGDYTIVVESVQMRGGQFGLRVEAK